MRRMPPRTPGSSGSEGPAVSKYDPLWAYVAADGRAAFTLRFDQIAAIVGLPIDHAFLIYKKELTAYGYRVGKISMKGQTVAFEKL